MFVLCSDCDLDSLIKEQYFLARKANIGFAESQMMADFERVMIIGMLSKDLKEEADIYNDIGKN
jgi:hypothetical protein